MTRGIGRALTLLALPALSGCMFQAEIIRSRHYDLNRMIRQTAQEQLLLNIVRLRYDETPYFLQVSSITTNFAAGGSAGASGTLPDVGPDVLGLNAGISYTESPSVTWALPDSREFLGRLHAPMGADQLTVLTQSGLDPGLVLRLGVKKANRLRNVEFDLTEGLYVPESFDRFVEMLDLLSALRREGLVDLTYGVYSTTGGGKLPLSKMDPRAMPGGLPYGLHFLVRDDPNEFEPLKLSKPLFLRFSLESDEEPRARRLRELLDLDPTAYSFAIVDSANSGREMLLSESGRLSQVMDPSRPLKEIMVNNRSVMEVLRFASAYVEVPSGDLEKGTVRERSAPDREWLQIRSSRWRPRGAWLQVERDGTWYYIAGDDLGSRVSFTLLDSLFASVVGQIPGSKPLLTLPVK